MTKKNAPPIKPYKVRGWLFCDQCHVTAEFQSLGEGPTADGGWPLHRCGYDIRPFTGWSDRNPKRDQTYTPEEGKHDHQAS
jgi:hypothetical protein